MAVTWIRNKANDAWIRVAGGDGPASHTIASHSDTTATGPNLNTLVGGGDADALHGHDTLASKDFALITALIFG